MLQTLIVFASLCQIDPLLTVHQLDQELRSPAEEMPVATDEARDFLRVRIVQSDAFKGMIQDAVLFAADASQDPALKKLSHGQCLRLGLAMACENPSMLQGWSTELMNRRFDDKEPDAFDLPGGADLNAAFARTSYAEQLKSPHRLDALFAGKSVLEDLQKSPIFAELVRDAYLGPGSLAAEEDETLLLGQPPSESTPRIREAIARRLLVDPQAPELAETPTAKGNPTSKIPTATKNAPRKNPAAAANTDAAPRGEAVKKLASTPLMRDAWSLGIDWTSAVVLADENNPTPETVEKRREEWGKIQAKAERLGIDVPALPEQQSFSALITYLIKTRPSIEQQLQEKHSREHAKLFGFAHDLIMITMLYNPKAGINDRGFRDPQMRILSIALTLSSLELPRENWDKCSALIVKKAPFNEVSDAVWSVIDEYDRVFAASKPTPSKTKPEPKTKPAPATTTDVLPPSEQPETWAFWEADGYFYSGHIERMEGEKRLFRYDDGDSKLILSDDLILHTLAAGNPCQANSAGRGKFYEGTVVSRSGARVRVRYKNSREEEVSLAQVRLSIHSSAQLKPGRRVVVDWQGDDYWYPAIIEQREEQRYFVKFHDGVTGWYPFDDVKLLSVNAGDLVQADYPGRGKYYLAEVQNVVREKEQLSVLYENGSYENTTFSHLRFKYEEPRSPTPDRTAASQSPANGEFQSEAGDSLRANFGNRTSTKVVEPAGRSRD